MTNADLQKAFDAGYAAAKALYSILKKGGIEVTEADIKKIAEEVLNELTSGGETIDPKYLPDPVVLEVPYAVFVPILEGITEALPLDAEMAGIIEKAYSDNVPLCLRTNTSAGVIQIKYEWTNYRFDKTTGETTIMSIGMMNLGQILVSGITYTRNDGGASITSESKTLS